MKQNLLTAMLLMAAMIASGCSKSESDSNADYTGINMEENSSSVTIRQLVGVWRNGKYFVAISEDGYLSAYFPIDGDERIDEGMFSIDGNTISVRSSFYWKFNRYTVTSVSDTSINLKVTYSFRDTSMDNDEKADATAALTLVRSSDTPTPLAGGLDGKTFSVDGTYTDGNGKAYSYTQVNLIYNGKYHYIQYHNDFKDGRPEDFDENMTLKYYVLLGRDLYSVALSHYDIPFDEPSRYLRGTKVEVGTLSEKEDGTLEYTKEH